MRQVRPVGRQAAAQKYDILTALGAFACAGDKHLQRTVLRLMTLIVARYNWQSDELCVGQAEMASLWSVDERTVKRELARLRDLGWLVVKRPAGRGRVTAHGLDLDAMLQTTRPRWDSVGPDFVARMGDGDTPPTQPAINVVAFPQPTLPDLPEGSGPWDRACARLRQEDPALFAAWLAPLTLRAGQGDTVLLAPSRFHATFLATHHRHRLARALALEGLVLSGIEPR